MINGAAGVPIPPDPLHAAAPPAGAVPAGVVDTSQGSLLDLRGLAKPRYFNGEEQQWSEWRFMFENWSALLGIDQYLTEIVVEATIVPDVQVMDETMKRFAKSLQRPVLARHRQSVSNGTVGSALQRVRGMATSCQRVRKQCQPRSFSGYSGGASCTAVAEFAVHAGARTKHSAMGDEDQRVRDVLHRTDLPGISQVSHHPQVRTRRCSQHASDVVTGTQI